MRLTRISLFQSAPSCVLMSRAEKLFANAEKYAVEKYERLKKMAE